MKKSGELKYYSVMDFGTNTESFDEELKLSQENVLLDIVKELSNETDSQLSSKLRGKVNRIVADCDLRHHTSLHKVTTADEGTTTLLGFMHQSAAELTFEEQTELNQAFINKIEKKLPSCNSELEHLKNTREKSTQLQKDKIKELKERDSKLATLQEQENEKMDLMMEWLNHRIHGATKYSDNCSELLSLKTKILNVKSKILHLQILRNIFTETNHSIKAYTEVHKDLKDSIKDSEQRIQTFKDIMRCDSK